MSDPQFRPFGHHAAPDHFKQAEETPHSDDNEAPRPGPQLLAEQPLGFWLRRGLLALPCLFGAAGCLIGGALAIVFALIAALTGHAPGSLDGSQAVVSTLLIVGAASIVPGLLLGWEAMLILSRRTRVRPWASMLAFGVVATALWTALLVVAWPGTDVAVAGVVFPYTLVLSVLALWRGQPDGVRISA
jgi:hypothetical protein